MSNYICYLCLYLIFYVNITSNTNNQTSFWSFHPVDFRPTNAKYVCNENSSQGCVETLVRLLLIISTLELDDFSLVLDLKYIRNRNIVHLPKIN